MIPTAREALIPLTSSLYVPGTIKEVKSVLVDIGTGYFAEKDLDSSITFCDVRNLITHFFLQYHGNVQQKTTLIILHNSSSIPLSPYHHITISPYHHIIPMFLFSSPLFLPFLSQAKIEHVSKNVETVQNAVNSKYFLTFSTMRVTIR